MAHRRPLDKPTAVALTTMSLAACPVGVLYLPTELPPESSRHVEVVPLDLGPAFPQGLGIEHATGFLPPSKPVDKAAVTFPTTRPNSFR